MQVTISLLPSSLSLVHIPRSRITHLSHPILKQVLRPDPTFLNITCNEVELSLFADESILEDFEPIARKDRRKQRTQSNSSTGRRGSHNNSGARVNEVSAPLATAGISILYQSSYMSDFILVKESRMQEAMSLLAEAGFEIYSSTDTQTSPINAARPSNRSSVHDFRPDPVVSASMTRARSGTDPTGVKLNSHSVWEGDHQKPFDGTTPLPEGGKPPRQKSTSPTSGDVHLLPSDLACVGLSEELGADYWGLKIVKLVAFPDMILPSAPPPYAPRASARPPVIPASLFNPKSSTTLSDFSPPVLASRDRSSFSSTSDSTVSCSEDDGYFSHSPQTKSSISIVTSESASRSQTNLRDPAAVSPYKHRSRHIIQPFSPVSSTKYNEVAPEPAVPHPKGSRIPFFSYTRTAEGSSLTADVFILAALFPPPERHMIICGGELDAADNRLAEPTPLNGMGEDAADDRDSEGSILTCLQIDLQRFGLDKYGLVNRFSKVLEQNRINHMYSSTFKTANLLIHPLTASL
ncbi:hypothetical protein H0H87_001696 [Tephrocybe sp. NHM501043]|nr:hypothetical protein H0H87_001696 [Tephrocybe sp. NHM501043]